MKRRDEIVSLVQTQPRQRGSGGNAPNLPFGLPVHNTLVQVSDEYRFRFGDQLRIQRRRDNVTAFLRGFQRQDEFTVTDSPSLIVYFVLCMGLFSWLSFASRNPSGG